MASLGTYVLVLGEKLSESRVATARIQVFLLLVLEVREVSFPSYLAQVQTLQGMGFLEDRVDSVALVVSFAVAVAAVASSLHVAPVVDVKSGGRFPAICVCVGRPLWWPGLPWRQPRI